MHTHGTETGKDTIYSPQQFEALLQRERARADRSGTEFSLIIFSVNGLQDKDSRLRRFQRAMRSRIRAVDDLGWFQEHLLGLLLPFTDFKGASSFAGNLEARLGGKGKLFPYSVFSYPTKWYRSGIWRRLGKGGTPTKQPPGEAPPQAGDPQAFAVEVKVDAVLAGKFPGWKRAFDVSGALIGILLSLPILLLLFLFVKVVSPGPVLFRQERVGYRGRLFTFLKVRTMHVNNDVAAHRAHLKELIRSGVPMVKLDASKDPRVIPGGAVLRRACLDELPQLFNVLKGEMSLVGPRPCLPYEAEEYERWHAHRFDVKPGMTGLWQVSGKNNLTFQQMVRLDIAYSTSLSLGKDIEILLRTVPAIAGFLLEAIGRRIELLRAGRHSKADAARGEI